MANSTKAAAAAAEARAGGGRVAARSSVWDSIRGCGILGISIDKKELRRKIVMPEYLRSAMAEAIRAQDVSAGVEAAKRSGGTEEKELPEAPLVVFVNSRSGGRHGPQLMLRMQELISEEQVPPPLPTFFFALYFMRFSTALSVDLGLSKASDLE